MIGHIYFIFGLLLFLFSLNNTSSINKFYRIENWVLKFKKVTGNLPKKTDFKNNDYNIYTSVGIYYIIEFSWLCIGLISSNWVLFLIFTLLSILMRKIISYSPIFMKIFFGFIFNLFISSFIFYSVINHFHFKNLIELNDLVIYVKQHLLVLL